MRNRSSFYARVAVLALATAVFALLFVGNASRSQAAGDPQPKPAAPKVIHTDDYQRSARLDTYRVIADSGAGAARTFIFTSVGCVTTSTPDRSVSEGTF